MWTKNLNIRVIQANNLLLSYSKIETHYDNVVIESFYKILKREGFNKYGFKGKAEAIIT